MVSLPAILKVPMQQNRNCSPKFQNFANANISTDTNNSFELQKMQNFCFTSIPLGGDGLTSFKAADFFQHRRKRFSSSNDFFSAQVMFFSPSGACSTSTMFFQRPAPGVLEHVFFSRHMFAAPECFLGDLTFFSTPGGVS